MSRRGGSYAPSLARRERKEESPASPSDGDKPFDEVVKGMEVIPGLFTLYRKAEEGKVLCEILPERFDTIYLCSPTLETGTGEGAFLAATVMEEYPVVFHRVGKNVHLLRRNVAYRAEGSAPLGRAMARSFSDALLGQAKVASQPHPDRKSVLVDLGALLVADVLGLALSLKEQYKSPYSFDESASSFGQLKGFPRNVEVETILHFKTSEPKASVTLADPRSLFLHLRYSLSALPETGYRPRLPDDRVGHFLALFADYSTDRRETPYTRYIARWHLEKADPSAAVSRPVQPVVFWLENTIPERYRDAVTEGVLLWNQAFEPLGFEGAIEVRQQPDTAGWDPADIRFSTVRWFVAPGAGFAQGPSRVDPFTGQIYDADIRVSADMLRFVWLQHGELVEPVSRHFADPLLPRAPIRLGPPGGPAGGTADWCHLAEGASAEAAFGWRLLEARGTVGIDSAATERYLHDFIVHVIAHEVGHTLGLRHNFKASTVHPVGDLQDAGRMASEGLTGSVMDYTPVNLAPEGSAQGPHWQTTLGPYDLWAIEYAYRPIAAATPEEELPVLQEIAARSTDPRLAYGTDEDTFAFDPVPRGIDPTANVWDLGDDPLAYFRGRLAIAQELWGKIESHFSAPGLRYPKLRIAFTRGLREYAVAALDVPKYIGGIYHRRDHLGDPGGRIPLEPVPAVRQREALAFRFSPGLLNKLAPERFWDFEGTVWRMQRLDFPIHDLILAIQAQPLDRLYHPLTLSRIADLEIKYPAGAERFTLSDLFGGLRAAIWAEVSTTTNISSFRRNLQRDHLQRLIALVVEPAAGVPADASTLARADLVALRQGIDGALAAGSLDRITRAHLAESRARIVAALEASLQRRIHSEGGRE